LVHRPRSDDWSLPKGKIKRGEHPLAGAVREVHEETGVRGLPGVRLPTVTYEVWAGDSLVDKQVDYWAMTASHGFSPGEESFTPGNEVDSIEWLPAAEALRRLSYSHDRRVLRAFTDLPALDRPVILARHATAGQRRPEWPADLARPLDEAGMEQAARMAAVLRLFAPDRLLSAEPLRCQQTLGALAAALDLDVHIDPRFDEDAPPDEAAAVIRKLASPDHVTVICSQGRLIPAAIAALRDETTPQRYRTAKGDAWALSFAGSRLVAQDLITLDDIRPMT
jgi:8-oxo-dGTP diphosphatase